MSEESGDDEDYLLSQHTFLFNLWTAIDLLLNCLLFLLLLSTVRQLYQLRGCHAQMYGMAVALMVYYGSAFVRRVGLTVMMLALQGEKRSKAFSLGTQVFCCIDLLFLPTLVVVTAF